MAAARSTYGVVAVRADVVGVVVMRLPFGYGARPSSACTRYEPGVRAAFVRALRSGDREKAGRRGTNASLGEVTLAAPEQRRTAVGVRQLGG
jgi:hypothetical protein